MACSDWLRRDVLEIERDLWACSFFFFFLSMYTLLYLFIWSHWVFVTARELSLVAERGSYSICSSWASHSGGCIFLQSTDSGHAGFR